jgi:hypothetical protein
MTSSVMRCFAELLLFAATSRKAISEVVRDGLERV